MYCYKCGTENPQEAKFCRSCGRNIYNQRFNQNEASVVEEKHSSAKMFFDNKMYKEAWNLYFEILEIDPEDHKAKQMIDDLKLIFKRNNSKENITSRFWFIVAMTISVIAAIIFSILVNNI